MILVPLATVMVLLIFRQTLFSMINANNFLENVVRKVIGCNLVPNTLSVPVSNICFILHSWIVSLILMNFYLMPLKTGSNIPFGVL